MKPMTAFQAALMGALFGGISPIAMGQTPPAQGSATTTVSPAEGFGASYGTGNLANAPMAVIPQHDMHARAPVVLTPADVRAAQEVRRQPPASFTPYVAYLRNDRLLNLLQTATSAPSIDPTVVVILAWNHVALDMTSIDHTTAGTKIVLPGSPNPTPVFESTYGEQFGPPRSSRALAIVHLAMFEAVNVVDHRYASYVPTGETQDVRTGVLATLAGTVPAPETASAASAASQAARDALVALYPKKKDLIDVSMLQIGVLVAAQEQARAPGAVQSRLSLGQRIGAAAASSVLAARKNDQSDAIADPTQCLVKPGPQGTTLPSPLCWEEYWPTATSVVPQDPFAWVPDTISVNSLRLGARWKNVTPFGTAARQFVADDGLILPGGKKPRPKPTDPDFINSLDNDGYGPTIADPRGGLIPISSKYGVRAFGGFGPAPGTVINPPPNQGPRYITTSQRMPLQTEAAQFWGYDATALLCAPPRLYNMIATSFLADHMTSLSGDHQAVDAARYLALVNIALADAGIASWDAKFTYNVARPISYIRFHKPQLDGDDTWTPLGQTSSNGAPDNITPPFPSYPSGHAVFGAAAFKMMADTLGVDMDKNSDFSFVSDEFNGETVDSNGKVRPRRQAHFISLSAASWENAESRIWLGIHWQRDADDGIALGNEIADVIFAKALKPLTKP